MLKDNPHYGSLPKFTNSKIDLDQGPSHRVSFKHRNTLIAGFSAAIGSIGLGTVIGYTSPAVPDLNANRNSFHLTDLEIALVTSISAIGAIVGDPVGGYLSDKFGRKSMLIVIGVPFILGWVSMATSSQLGISFLYAGRLITGFSAGAVDTVVPLYLAEISSKNVRGFVGSCHELSTNLGLMSVFVLGCFLHWNWLAIGCVVFPATMLVLMLFMPESPRWLLVNGYPDEARRALMWFRGNSEDISEEIKSIEDNIKLTESAVTWSELISPSIYKPFLIIATLMFFQQVSGYGVIPQYMVYIFQTAGSTWDPYIQTAVVGIAGVLANIVSAFVVDWAGRRVMLVTSSTIMTVSMCFLACFFTVKEFLGHFDIGLIGWLPVVSLITYNFGVALGYGPVPFVLAGELFPIRVRGLAVGMAISLLWCFTFIINISFPGLLLVLGDFGVYWLLAAICFIGTLYPYFAVPETKGKSLEEIEQEFRQ